MGLKKVNADWDKWDIWDKWDNWDKSDRDNWCSNSCVFWLGTWEHLTTANKHNQNMYLVWQYEYNFHDNDRKTFINVKNEQ